MGRVGVRVGVKVGVRVGVQVRVGVGWGHRPDLARRVPHRLGEAGMPFVRVLGPSDVVSLLLEPAFALGGVRGRGRGRVRVRVKGSHLTPR